MFFYRILYTNFTIPFGNVSLVYIQKDTPKREKSPGSRPVSPPPGDFTIIRPHYSKFCYRNPDVYHGNRASIAALLPPIFGTGRVRFLPRSVGSSRRKAVRNSSQSKAIELNIIMYCCTSFVCAHLWGCPQGARLPPTGLEPVTDQIISLLLYQLSYSGVEGAVWPPYIKV